MGSFTIAPAAGSNQAPAGMRRLDLFPPLCPERPGPRIAASPSNGSDMAVMEGALYPIPTSALNNPIGKSRVRPAWLPSHYPHPAIRPDKAKGRVFAEGPKRSQSGPYGHFDFRVCRPWPPWRQPPWWSPWPPWRPSPPARQVHYRYGATPVAYAVTRHAVAGPCTCLSKQYTPEGAVLFKDIRAEKVSSRNLLQA